MKLETKSSLNPSKNMSQIDFQQKFPVKILRTVNLSSLITGQYPYHQILTKCFNDLYTITCIIF